MLLAIVKTHRRASLLLLAGFVVVSVAGCGGRGWREYLGLPKQNDPSVHLRSTEPRWLLISNPRFGDVASEPEYIWVEEDKVPTTLKSFVFGKSSLIAPPEIVAKYGSPPGGGRISTRQGGAYKVENVVPTIPTSGSPVAAVSTGTRTDAASCLTAAPATRGYVVFVDTSRVIIDLAASDGVKVGTGVSLRRDKIAIVHPITGELLGELDEEVGTARIVELRDKFSVAEIQAVAAGSQIQVKDRVVQK